MPTASSSWKTSLRKVRTLWHCSRLRSVALYYDWSWWYPSGNRPLQPYYLGFTAGRLVMVSSSMGLTAWLQNSKEAGGTVREIDVWAGVTTGYPLWLSASSSACHGLLIITGSAYYRKPSATKMPNWSWRTRQLWHADASAWCCCARCKNTRRS